MTLIGLSGAEYRLASEPFNNGGEGDIYRVVSGGEKRVAKLYHDGTPSRELQEKLIIMVNRQPNALVLEQVAWPLDVLYDAKKTFRGFVMPELNINAELIDVYKYPSTLNVTTRQKVIIAQNICAVISEIHTAGFVFGDFNPRNIGVNINTGKVAFLDTDTYHVTDDKTNKVYRCNVCAQGYAAPELLKKCAEFIRANPNDKKQVYAKTPLPTFTKETDNFALAVHIFKLLMNGYTPFGGIKNTDSHSQASPGVGDAAILRDNYCFKPGNKPQSPAVLPMDAFQREITELFERAFIYGKTDGKYRPSAAEWHTGLEKLEAGLIDCGANPLHQYSAKNLDCPLCEADKRYCISTGQNVPIVVAPSISQKVYGNEPVPVVQPPLAMPVVVPQPVSVSRSVPHSRPATPPVQEKTKVSYIAMIAKSKYRFVFATALFALVFIGLAAGIGGFINSQRDETETFADGTNSISLPTIMSTPESLENSSYASDADSDTVFEPFELSATPDEIAQNMSDTVEPETSPFVGRPTEIEPSQVETTPSPPTPELQSETARGAEYYAMGLAAFNAMPRDYVAAIMHLENAHRLLNDEAEQWNRLLFMLGVLYYWDERLSEAHAILSELGERTPGLTEPFTAVERTLFNSVMFELRGSYSYTSELSESTKELPTNKLYTVRRIFAEMQGAKTAACWRHARFFVTQTFGKKTRNV